MKSLKEYSMNLPEKEYHEYPAWSYSLIAKYAKEGFSAIPTLHDPVTPTPSMEFGSLFDTIMTKSRKEFEDEYVIDETGVSCQPAEREVFDKIIALGFGEYSYANLAGMHMDSLTEIMRSCDTFCSKYKKDETRFAKLYENAAYYELRRTGKKVISRADFDEAVEMAKIMWSKENTMNIFRKGERDGVEYIYQAQFMDYVTLDSGKEAKIKIMPDLMIVNHNDKTIQPVDLKTSSIPGWQFKDNFIKYRYDIQAELYTDILNKLIDSDADYRSYTVLPYIFADISRSDKVPVTYVYDPSEGFSFDSNGKTYTYKGWRELLDEILDYEESNAVVPSYIKLDEPNDLRTILGK